MIRLTPRQREVMQLLSEGKVVKEIAVILGIPNRRTVDYHVAQALRKLHCTTRAHGVATLIRMEQQEHNCLFS